MLFLFLPILLYWESVTTSLREIRRNFRWIVAMSTLLVFATAATVAVVAHSLGLQWGAAWVLGAAVAPTDATAVGVLARALSLRDVTVLRAESLINDGTALVIYGLAVGITVGEQQLTFLHVSWLVLLSYGGGIAAGVVTAGVWVWARKRMSDPLLENVAILLIPFTAYLLAELVDASGVLAVVVAGLIMSQASPHIGQPGQRRQTESTWELTTFLLNGALFVLVGIEVQAAVRQLTTTDLALAFGLAGIISAVVIGVRFLFVFGTGYLGDRDAFGDSVRTRVVHSLSGFRGAISLAVALSVPATLDSGERFPDRDIIVFVTAIVIVVTLAQALLLPKVVRWARLGDDASIAEEYRYAEETAMDEAMAALPGIAAELGISSKLAADVQTGYQRRRKPEEASTSALPPREQVRRLRLALIQHRRATIVRLRDEGRIDDVVLRDLQGKLDHEELQLIAVRAA